MSVLIETTLGSFVIDLYIDKKPNTCRNFLKLCKAKYYNFCVFHSVEGNFIAQTGDPTGTGRGGESIFTRLYGEQAKFIEREAMPIIKHTVPGLVSMVNNGANGHGSQFFVTLGSDLSYLDDVHSVFGEIAENLDIVQKFSDAICDEEHRPYVDILITHTIILDDPFPDDPKLAYPSRSPSPSVNLLKTMRIGIDEDLDEMGGKTVEELQEEIESKEARARAHVLEMVGDLHHAEEKPPDNVLFVCKLNSVTTDEDLEIIFSRFGKIKCCEIIRDKKTGNSLQYAFVEFERAEDCEKAYFKMDNVLIDDRRIHVDFSQSVAKNYQWDRKRDNTRESTEGTNERRHKHSRERRRSVSHDRKNDHKKRRRTRSPELRPRQLDSPHHSHRDHAGQRTSEKRRSRSRDRFKRR